MEASLIEQRIAAAFRAGFEAATRYNPMSPGDFAYDTILSKELANYTNNPAMSRVRGPNFVPKESRPNMAPEPEAPHPAIRTPVIQNRKYEDYYHADGTPKRMRPDGSTF